MEPPVLKQPIASPRLGKMENHARHTGVHAAGIIVTEEPVHKYCSVSHQSGAAMIDKKDAEDLNLLKIDFVNKTWIFRKCIHTSTRKPRLSFVFRYLKK